jgi:hypothetical protein
MHKLVPALVLVTAASVLCGASVGAQTRLVSGLHPPSEIGPFRNGGILLIGGMGGGGMTGGGMTGGGMIGGGMTGGGMTGGGMTGGGMTGGGMTGGGMTGGGMTGGGMTGGGMTGGGMTGGGMTGGGMTGGGMTGGGMTGGGMTGGSWGNFGAASDTAESGNSAQSVYYTYQCVTPTAQCSFVAPASLRSTSLKAGAGCSCSRGRDEGHVR